MADEVQSASGATGSRRLPGTVPSATALVATTRTTRAESLVGVAAGAAGATSSLASLATVQQALTALRPVVRARTASGTVVRLDGKPACDAGPYGSDWGRLRETVFDPNWCVRDRDRVQPPVLRLDVPCAELHTLFWPDVYQQVQLALATALGGKPRPADAWKLRADWTRGVLELVSIALEATNIQPIFHWPAAWATVQPYRAVYDVDGAPRLMDGGEYTSGFDFDGRPYTAWPDGSTKRVLGGCEPRALHAFRERSYEVALAEMRSPVLGAWRRARDAFRAEWGVPGWAHWLDTDDLRVALPSLSGVHWGREAYAAPSVTAGPAMLAGSCIATASPLAKTLKGDHDPWTVMGFSPLTSSLSHGQVSFGPAIVPEPIARLSAEWPRIAYSISDACTGLCSPDWDAMQRVSRVYAGRPLADYMNALFRTTQGAASGTVRGFTWLEPFSAGLISADRDAIRRAMGSPSDTQIKLNMRVPNSQWYLEAAATWAGVITTTRFQDFVGNSTAFYMVNHYTYYARKGLIQMSAAEAAELAEGARQLRSAVATMGFQLGAELVGRMNENAGQIVSNLSQSIADDVSRYASHPDLPKSLYRRISSATECGGSGADAGGGRGVLPWLLGAGGLAGGFGLAYALTR